MKKGNGISRRNFLALAGISTGAAAMTGLAGCAPSGSQAGAQAENAPKETTDWIGASPEIAESDIVETKTTDILIIGAGNAGMSAAATAADMGADFILCDGSGSVQSSRHWVGGINTKWHKEAGITIDEKKVLNELTRYSSGLSDQTVWKTWIRESGDTIEFINGIMEDAGFSIFLDTEGYDHATGGTDFFVPPIQHMWYDETGAEIGGGPSALAGETSANHRNAVLASYIESKGAEIAFQHTLVKLVRENDNTGRVNAAIFDTSDGYVKITAQKGIVLATGGYAANPVMMAELQKPAVKSITQAMYMPNCKGEGIKAALHIGADMDNSPAPMIFDRGQVEPGVNTGLVGEGEKAAFPTSHPTGLVVGSLPFMKVNRHGRRFFNESAPYDWCTFAASKQPGGVWCSIFDSNAPEDALRFSVVGCAKIATMQLQMGPIDAVFESFIEEGVLMKADTLEELAQKLELPEEAFLEEVERYNALYDAQEDTDFGKEDFRLSALKQPPYYGFWSGGQLLTTLDGIRINADMQVLDADSEVIEGLYAAGDCSGSLFSGNYPEYFVGNACGRTITEGRHAVRHIAGISS